jgi:hypothetical protein
MSGRRHCRLGSLADTWCLFLTVNGSDLRYYKSLYIINANDDSVRLVGGGVYVYICVELVDMLVKFKRRSASSPGTQCSSWPEVGCRCGHAVFLLNVNRRLTLSCMFLSIFLD